MKKHKSMLNVSWGGIRNEKWEMKRFENKHLVKKYKIATEKRDRKVHGYFSVLWIINLLNAFYMNINVFIKWYCCSIYLDLCWMLFPLIFLSLVFVVFVATCMSRHHM